MIELERCVELYNKIPDDIVDMISRLDGVTYSHVIHVCKLCRLIEKELGDRDEALSQHLLSEAGLVHDIGKYFISTRVLGKPEHLTRRE